MALTWQACSHLAVRRMRPRIARGGLQVRCCLGTRYDRGSMRAPDVTYTITSQYRSGHAEALGQGLAVL